MSIKSIRIQNILSFQDLYIDSFEEINCIIGRNNVGKSNLLKVIKYFYQKLINEKVLPLELNSNYSSFGTISIEYDISFLSKIVNANKNDNIGYFQVISKKYIKYSEEDTIVLELSINSNDSIKWNIEDNEFRNIIADVYPFFDLASRHIEPKDWTRLWNLISRLKPFNPHKIKTDKLKEFFDIEISGDARYKKYSEYIDNIEKYLEIDRYKHSDKVLNFVKSGLRGEKFLIDSKSIDTQSDGTNTYKFLEAFLSLMIVLTKKSYISPIVYIDEPEIGFHPKRSEEFIEKIYELFSIYTYNRPYPTICIATHSPNIIKQIIKLFQDKHQVLHFSKNKKNHSIVNRMNSKFNDERFLNIFSDNEARLFFSRFILFVEGETELEIFGNQKLKDLFPVLKKIDVYKSSSNVLSSNLNPSYNNSSIPYLYLYDVDKMIDIDLENKKIVFKNDLINLKDLNKKYKRSYVISKQNIICNFLEELFEWQKNSKNLLEFDRNIFIKCIDYESKIKEVNIKLLNKLNYHINKTTIEEVLINHGSKNFFIKWLKQIIINYIRNSFLDVPVRKKRKQLLIKEMKKINCIKKHIFCNLNLRTNFLLALILLFNGKTETLISMENNKFNDIDNIFKDELKNLKELINKKAKFMNQMIASKTSGWATKFINYSLSEIELKLTKEDIKERNEEFRKIFKQNFEELFSIILFIEKALDDR